MSTPICVICAGPITERAKYGRPLETRTTCSEPCRIEDNRRRNRATPQPEPTCTYCTDPLVYAGSGKRPTCCWKADCRRQYSNARSKAYQERQRTGTLPATRGRKPRPESAEYIDRLVAVAEQRRKWHEATTGRRRYTITDPWQQRSDVNAYDRGGCGWGYK